MLPGYLLGNGSLSINLQPVVDNRGSATQVHLRPLPGI